VVPARLVAAASLNGGRLSWRPLSFQTKRVLSAFGTKRTSQNCLWMSAIEGKADIIQVMLTGYSLNADKVCYRSFSRLQLRKLGDVRCYFFVRDVPMKLGGLVFITLIKLFWRDENDLELIVVAPL
jgi:hypothetical protein